MIRIRLGFDARALNGKLGGVPRYSVEMIDALSCGDQVELVLFSNQKIIYTGSMENVEVVED